MKDEEIPLVDFEATSPESQEPPLVDFDAESSASLETGADNSAGVIDIAKATVQTVAGIGQAIGDNIPGQATAGIAALGNAIVHKGIDAYMGNDQVPFTDLYDTYKNRFQEDRREERINRPGEAIAGDIGAFVAGGAATKGLKYGPKAYKHLLKMTGGAASLFTRPGVRKAVVTMGNATIDAGTMYAQHQNLKNNNVSVQEELEMHDILGAFALSTGVRTAANVVGAGLSSTANFLDEAISDENVVKAATTYMGKTISNGFNKIVNKKAAQGVKRETIYKEFREHLKEVGADDLEVLNNPALLRDNSTNLIQQEGSKLGGLYTKIDDITGRAPLNTSTMLDDIQNSISMKYGDDAIVQKQMLEPTTNVLNNLLRNADGSTKPLSLKQLWQIEKNIRSLDKQIPSEVKGDVLESFRKLRNEYSDDFVKKTQEYASKSSDDLLALKMRQEAIEAQINNATNNLKNTSMTNIADDATQVLDGNVLKAAEQRQANILAAGQKEVDVLQKQLDNTISQIESVKDVVKRAPVPNMPRTKIGESNTATFSKQVDPEELNQIASEVKPLSQKLSRLYDLDDNVISKLDISKTPSSTIGMIARGMTSLKTIGVGLTAGKYAMASKVGLETAANQFQKLAATSSPEFVKSATRASRFFRNAAGAGDDPFISSLLTGVIAQTQNENISNDEYMRRINVADSKTLMYLRPMERSLDKIKTDDLLFENVMNLVEDIDPPLVAELNSALADNRDDDAAAILDQVSRVKGYERFFEAGQGWGNKLYDPAQRQMVADSIKADLMIPGLAKQQLVDQVMNTGELPDKSQFVRQPKTYTPRDKNKVR